jgi:hypothetical protein
MKRFVSKTMLAAVGGALLAQAAQAAPDDLVLGFTLTGAANDYIVDLGPGSSIGAGGGSVVDLSSGFGFSSATLTTTFGSGNVANGLNVGVVGGAATGLPGQDLWVTQARSGGAGNAATPGSALQGGTTSSGSSGSPFPNGVLSGTGLTAGNGVVFSAADSSSFSSLIYNGNPNFVTTMGGLNPAGTTSGSVVYEDLYREVDSNPGRGGLQGNWAYQGYLTLDLSGGTSQLLTFTPASIAVPEPSTYGLIAGAGLLIISLRRQLGFKSV